MSHEVFEPKPPAGPPAAVKKEPRRITEKRIVLTLRVESVKKVFKLGEPIILRTTLQKSGDAISLLEMKELVNVRATGSFEPKDGSGKEQLPATAKAFVVPKGRDITPEKEKLKKEQERYLKLYPHLAESKEKHREPFPQRKHFYDMPKGVFSLKKEIYLEKLLMITRPGTVTFQIQYDNRLISISKAGRGLE